MVVKRPQLGAFFVSGYVYREKCVAGTILGLFALHSWSMLQAMRRYLYILLMLFCFSANAEIYKRVDENGNVHYSDNGADGAEQVELSKGNSFPPTATKATSTSADKKRQESRYTNMAIVKPKMNGTIRDNNGDVPIAIDLAPALVFGHSISLDMDGKTVLKDQTKTAFTLKKVERGSHTLRARVIGSDGSVLISSKSIIFHLQKKIIDAKSGTSKDNSKAFTPDYNQDSSQPSGYKKDLSNDYRKNLSKDYDSSDTYKQKYNQGVPANSGSFAPGSGYKPNYNQN